MLIADSLWALIERRAELTPDALFALDESDQRLSFAEYRVACERSAAGLFARGLREDGRVSWLLPTGLDALVLIGALARLGVRQNPILPIYRQREVGFITRQSQAELLIVQRPLRGFDHAGMAAELAAAQPGLAALVLEDDLPAAEVASLPPATRAAASAPPIRWLFYTSGTTADPKGALHSDATLMAFAAGMAERLELCEDDRIALVFPISHVGGAGWLIAGLMAGAAQICVAHFQPASSIPVLIRHGVTQATAGTAFHQAYLEAQRAKGAAKLFPRIRSFPGGGAPKPPQLHHDVKRELGGAGVVSGYGMTECPVISMGCVHDSDHELAHSEGRPNPDTMQIRIVRADGGEAGSGEDGEIRVRGPQLFAGYLDPELNAAAFDEAGFLRTGDLGHVDAAGHLVITGRIKDVIIRKGENISAKEIEDLLYPHPKVADVAVIGLPDAMSGERCCAVVVSSDPQYPLRFDEMVAFLTAQRLMKQKLPEQLEHVAELPRNATGKVQKDLLRKRFAGG